MGLFSSILFYQMAYVGSLNTSPFVTCAGKAVFAYHLLEKKKTSRKQELGQRWPPPWRSPCGTRCTHHKCTPCWQKAANLLCSSCSASPTAKGPKRLCSFERTLSPKWVLRAPAAFEGLPLSKIPLHCSEEMAWPHNYLDQCNKQGTSKCGI